VFSRANSCLLRVPATFAIQIEYRSVYFFQIASRGCGMGNDRAAAILAFENEQVNEFQSALQHTYLSSLAGSFRVG
jgi:hypothetical protein